MNDYSSSMGENTTERQAGDATPAVTPSVIQILIIDAHFVVRRGIVTMLAAYSDLEPIEDAANAEEAIQQYGQIQPDIVLIDPGSTATEGVAAVRVVLTQWPETRAVTLTNWQNEPPSQSKMIAGAVRCLDKHVSADQLADAIREAGRN